MTLKTPRIEYLNTKNKYIEHSLNFNSNRSSYATAYLDHEELNLRNAVALAWILISTQIKRICGFNWPLVTLSSKGKEWVWPS